MKGLGLSVISLWVCLASGFSGPGVRWKIDFRLTLEEIEGEHVFVVAGTTDLPPGTRLRARVYAVEVVEDFRRGRREDEEPLLWEGDEEAGQPAFQNFRAGEGGFRIEVHRFRRKPWSILYRGRVHYLPRLQDDEDVLKRVGGAEFSRPADLRLGTPRTFESELRDRLLEAAGDLLSIHALYRELGKAFEERVRKPDGAAWKSWKAPWYSRLEKVADRNLERYGLWVLWMERQTRMGVGGLCEILRRILVTCTEHLEGDAEAGKRARERLEGFQDYFEDVMDRIGVPLPLEPDRVGPALEAYAEGFAPLRAWLERGGGDGGEIALRARRACTPALFRIASRLRIRRRAYPYLSEIAARLARLVDLSRRGKDGESLRKALGEHDAAVAEFRTFAGLP